MSVAYMQTGIDTNNSKNNLIPTGFLETNELKKDYLSFWRF